MLKSIAYNCVPRTSDSAHPACGLETSVKSKWTRARTLQIEPWNVKPQCGSDSITKAGHVSCKIAMLYIMMPEFEIQNHIVQTTARNAQWAHQQRSRTLAVDRPDAQLCCREQNQKNHARRGSYSEFNPFGRVATTKARNNLKNALNKCI